ncbi:TetR/AcrR family transcriptional regulator [Planosporangium mesophilum]|uniref:TetR family transcriptional regulator n=1 Tax=Planosporangium mesophilum TaxID=689768 RepID=A0A8J3T964_9ACTN|nr:TetR family transcriptional regulator C-terminal domain-containing protein [Planosporangium mesophilum]NJC81482.1 TetR family transcriptional regulator [Planosporangium mesophilum]GII20861.1 TetR family transcriptional regulator [Planosporangium mesophilum]
MSRTADRPTQEKLLSRAVWDVLAEQGLDRLTIRAVAGAAGCTTGLVMHRFPNRRALLLHARHLLHERTRQRMEAREATATDPRAALRAVLAQSLAVDADSRTHAVVWLGFLAAAVSDPELAEAHRTHNRAWRTRLIRLVSAAAPGWPESRVTTTANALIALVEGTAVLAAADPEAYPPDAQRTALDATLTAYGLA